MSINKEDLKKKYGTIYEVTVNEIADKDTYVFYFRNPGPADFGRFIKESSQKTVSSMRNIVTATIVEEQMGEFEAAAEKYPGIVVPITTELLKLLGVTADTMVKKL